MSGPLSEYAGYPHYVFVQDFETGLDAEDVSSFFKRNWHYSLYLSVAYLAVIFALREFMKNRKPVQVRRALIIWDASLAVFSICGMLRTVPELLYVMKNYGVEYSVCNSTVNSVTMFWVLAFVLSKAVELLDTVFIVLKKRQLTLLHVSHHVLTMTLLFFLAQLMPGGFRLGVSVNYSVHSFMYSYFALKAARFNIPLNVSMIITVTQILQFVVGIAGGVIVLRANLLGHFCTSKIREAVAFLIFVSFLLFMFVRFFFRKYKVTRGKRNVE